MIKTIVKVGNSLGLILDTALLDLAGLKLGDLVNVTVHDGGVIILTPIKRTVAPARATETIRRTVKGYRKTLRRLA